MLSVFGLHAIEMVAFLLANHNGIARYLVRFFTDNCQIIVYLTLKNDTTLSFLCFCPIKKTVIMSVNRTNDFQAITCFQRYCCFVVFVPHKIHGCIFFQYNLR